MSVNGILQEDLITAPHVHFLRGNFELRKLPMEQALQELKEIISLADERIEHPCHHRQQWSEHPFQYVEPLLPLRLLAVSLTKKSQVDSEVYVRCRKYSSRKISKPYPGSHESSKQKKKETSMTDLLVALKMATQKFEKDAIMEELLFWDEPERVIYNPTRWEFGRKQPPWLQSGASQQDGGEQSLKSATPIKQENQPANYENKIGEIEEMLLRTGALRARDLHKQEGIRGWVWDWGWGWRKPSSHADIMNSIVSPRRESASCVLLLMAAVLAAVTYRAAFTPPAATLQTQVYACNYGANGNFRLGKQDSTVTHSSIFFNFPVFFGSLSIMIFLLHDFPLKPWPQITVSTPTGSYMCAIVSTSPTLALALFLLATPLSTFAAAAKFHGFPRVTSYCNS